MTLNLGNIEQRPTGDVIWAPGPDGEPVEHKPIKGMPDYSQNTHFDCDPMWVNYWNNRFK